MTFVNSTKPETFLPAGNISAVDFVTQQSDELTEEYEQFCKDKSIDTGSEQSALAFMDYRDELFEESLSN